MFYMEVFKMFNICENTVLIGFEGYKISHIQHMINDSSKTNIKYKYFGKKVQKGNVKVLTKYGILNIEFDVENGWARKLVLS